MISTPSPPRTIAWIETPGTPAVVRILDQTRLPTELVYRDCPSVQDVWRAIRELAVRGAPAIGIAAAMGLALESRHFHGFDGDRDGFLRQLSNAANYLRASRPTAVNLFWAIERMERRARVADEPFSCRVMRQHLLEEALTIEREDRETCRAIGRVGADLIPDGAGVLTHCNAGGLATADYGTALAAIFTAHAQGKRVRVYVDETRPLLQGARLTAWELRQRGIAVTLICDNMAALVMKAGRVQLAIVGADRIAANGDTANKIGTYGVAVLAKAHGIPLYVAAPASTFDLALENGSGIPIEERDPREITHGFGRQTAPDGIDVYNPAFDVTPAPLITGIITEKGLIRPVTSAAIGEWAGRSTIDVTRRVGADLVPR